MRIAFGGSRREEDDHVVLAAVSSFAGRSTRRQPRMEAFALLDIICVLGILALGAIVALVGRGVEKL